MYLRYLYSEYAFSAVMVIFCSTLSLYARCFPLQDPDTFWYLA
jgi:hypothetical protein